MIGEDLQEIYHRKCVVHAVISTWARVEGDPPLSPVLPVPQWRCWPREFLPAAGCDELHWEYVTCIRNHSRWNLFRRPFHAHSRVVARCTTMRWVNDEKKLTCSGKGPTNWKGGSKFEVQVMESNSMSVGWILFSRFVTGVIGPGILLSMFLLQMKRASGGGWKCLSVSRVEKKTIASTMSRIVGRYAAGIVSTGLEATGLNDSS